MDIVIKRDSRGRERPQEKEFVEKRVVRVLPTSDLIRKYLKHQPSRIGWLKEGSVEWPLDTFTRNRLRDGDITIEAPQEQQAKQLEKSKKAEPKKAEPKKESTSHS